MSGVRFGALLLGLLALLASPARAGSLRIAVPSDGCPPPALLADLARLVVREAGLTPQVIRIPLADIPNALSHGAANAALAPSSAAAAATADNLGALPTLRLVLVPRASTAARSPRDLAGKTLAAYRADPCLMAMIRRYKAVPLPTPSTGTALKLALAGRADAVIGWERPVLDAMRAARYPARALAKPIVLNAVAPCLLLARSRAADRGRLRDALLHLLRNGTIDAEAARRLL